MKKLVLGFIGGCHVAGYLAPPSSSFVDCLDQSLKPTQIHRLPYVKINRITKVIEPNQALESNFIVMQLGNFEFSASWKQIIETTVGLPSWLTPHLSKKIAKSAKTEAFATSENEITQTVGPASSQTTTRRFMEAIKLVIGSSLYLITWLFMRKHKQQFQLLNQVINENPQSTFVCLSPFPCASETHTKIRRLGGLIMRRRIQDRPNLHWVDTHDLLKSRSNLFVDGIHLNKKGHTILANYLQLVFNNEH